jgi:hypothetical protein
MGKISDAVVPTNLEYRCQFASGEAIGLVAHHIRVVSQTKLINMYCILWYFKLFFKCAKYSLLLDLNILTVTRYPTLSVVFRFCRLPPIDL